MSWNNFNNSMQSDGGFMNNSVSEGTSSKGKASDSQRALNCVPIMIGHILRYGDKLVIWESGVKIISLVAIVREINQSSTKVSYMLEDETGKIKATSWLEEDKSDFESPVQINSYAKIYGLVRTYLQESYVLVLSIRPLDGLCDLVIHLMEVTMLCLEGEKISKGDYEDVQDSDSKNDVIPSLSEQQQMVLQIIQNGDDEYGAERDHIKANVPAHMAAEVDKIIEFLSTEGHIYTTKTDDFFKAI